MYQTLIKPFYQDIKKFVLDTLFPIKCLGCEKEGEFLCDLCKLKLARLEKQHCIVCEKPSIGGLTHPKCRTPFGADGLVSVLDYHDKCASRCLAKGKYHFLPEIFRIFGLLMSQFLQSNYADLLSEQFILTALPLHKRKQRWRGFNQAEVLCETLSQSLNLPYTTVLVRCKSTKTQKDIKKREERAKNMEGAFKLKKGANVRGQNLVLVDDVVTTGSTLLEAVKVLKRNGANSVWCLTVARD